MKNDDLFKRLGLENLSDEEKAGLSEDLGGVALERIAARFETLLTPEQAAEFEARLRVDEAAAFALLKEYIPGYPHIARQEIAALRAELIDTHDAVMKKLDKRKPGPK